MKRTIIATSIAAIAAFAGAAYADAITSDFTGANMRHLPNNSVVLDGIKLVAISLQRSSALMKQKAF